MSTSPRRLGERWPWRRKRQRQGGRANGDVSIEIVPARLHSWPVTYRYLCWPSRRVSDEGRRNRSSISREQGAAYVRVRLLSIDYGRTVPADRSWVRSFFLLCSASNRVIGRDLRR